MKDLRVKIKRQIEIVGLVLAHPGKYKIVDFEFMFDLQTSTVKRDLQEIRSWGIDLHSTGKSGIEITNRISPELLKEIIPQYMGIALSKYSHDSSVNLVVKKLKEKSLEFLVLLQTAIESHNKVRIKYLKTDDSKIETKDISPYCLFQSDKAWRLLANHDGVTKQYLINRIKKVETLEEIFKPISHDEIEDIFRTSFKSWLGDKRYEVKLKLLPPWPDRMSNRQIMEVQEITKNEDGSVIYKTTVNSLNEIASWIVSRGKGVVVLEPESLKKIVIETAKGVLENYK